MDEGSECEEDLTIKYKTNQSPNGTIESISGIKTGVRILIKLAAELTNFCGSFYVLNPYECFFIQRGRTYAQIWNELNNKS